MRERRERQRVLHRHRLRLAPSSQSRVMVSARPARLELCGSESPFGRSVLAGRASSVPVTTIGYKSLATKFFFVC